MNNQDNPYIYNYVFGIVSTIYSAFSALGLLIVPFLIGGILQVLWGSAFMVPMILLCAYIIVQVLTGLFAGAMSLRYKIGIPHTEGHRKVRKLAIAHIALSVPILAVLLFRGDVTVITYLLTPAYMATYLYLLKKTAKPESAILENTNAKITLSDDSNK